MTCKKCNGKGWYQYTTTGTPHSKPCEDCCKHDAGSFLHDDGNKYCRKGCGMKMYDTIVSMPSTTITDVLNERKRIYDLAKSMKSSEKGAQARGWNAALEEIIYATKDHETV